MTDIKYDIWVKDVIANLNQHVHYFTYKNGYCPSAILAGGEYFHAIRSDFPSIQESLYFNLLWKGIPLIRCSGDIKVKLVSDMTDVDLDTPPRRDV